MLFYFKALLSPRIRNGLPDFAAQPRNKAHLVDRCDNQGFVRKSTPQNGKFAANVGETLYKLREWKGERSSG